MVSCDETSSVSDRSSYACELLINSIDDAVDYRATRFSPDTAIAGCEMGQQEDRPSLYTGRLNAVCREEICGSVLLGWYAVDIETGQVWEWDIARERTGTEVVSTR